MLKHKCDRCPFRGEYQAQGFRPFGVCIRETDVIKAEKAYKAEVCPYEKILTEEEREILNKRIMNFPKWMRTFQVMPEETKAVITIGKWEGEEK
ncbi:hypothetical protein [Candidatus Proelusimicrobium excrementi]|uniref:hypothetical protein n=1 Tax=Candidatus Proelusimicrobium excrementi TaxID=3416222 RepID=UPI003C8E4769|nr:hypothetical protein [Elusimicrobiaceae bacterium]MBR3927710.1 hypothetical protein [Clostridia bacterium]